jgi:hypothetical protein
MKKYYYQDEYSMGFMDLETGWQGNVDLPEDFIQEYRAIEAKMDELNSKLYDYYVEQNPDSEEAIIARSLEPVNQEPDKVIIYRNYYDGDSE